MSKVDPDHLRLTYEAVPECSFFCNFGTDESKWNKEKASGGRLRFKTPYQALQNYKKCGKEGERVVLSPRGREIGHDWLVNYFKTSPPDDEFFNGFVTIELGYEGLDPDSPEARLGLCHQRAPISVAQAGRFTIFQAAKMCSFNKKDIRKLLKKYDGKRQTLCRSSFEAAGTVTLD